MAVTTLDAKDLKQAFDVFNRQSNRLEASYRALERKVVDLTRRLRREESARVSELLEKERLSEHLTALLEAVPGAILVLDGSGIVRECNSEAVRLLNRPLTGCAWSDVVHREACERDAVDGSVPLKDGRWLSLSRRPLQGRAGEILLLADVSESRNLAHQRERSERLTAIGEMTARFAHEVRTPLASAMLYASQLQPSTDRQARMVAKISGRLRDLGRMVDDMLGFAAGSQPCGHSIAIDDLLEQVETAVETQLTPGTLLRIRTGQPELAVIGNRNALQGALANLVINADQACGTGARICLSARSVDKDVLISVADNGPGIPDDVLPRLFEPFFTTRPQGTGLGLAVVHSVARSHGGDVDVTTSSLGSCFTLRLPQPGRQRSSGHE